MEIFSDNLHLDYITPLHPKIQIPSPPPTPPPQKKNVRIELKV